MNKEQLAKDIAEILMLYPILSQDQIAALVLSVLNKEEEEHV